MLSKPERNYYLNITLLLLGTVSVLTGIAMSIDLPYFLPFLLAIHIKLLHEYASYSLTVLVILHLIFHLDWFKAMTK
jgi:hypothetical protein